METLIGRIEDAHTISEIGREDDLAVGSRSCVSELAIDAQMHGNVVELEAHIPGIPAIRSVQIAFLQQIAT